MQLLNLDIDRIIIHQIYQRDPEGVKVTPTQSFELTNFAPAAMTEFKTRVRDALGEGSKAVQMEIVEQGEDYMPSIIDKLSVQDEGDFIVSSYNVAQKLADAQTRRTIPGGIVVVFYGTQGNPAKKFIGIIKAEIHSAYEKEVNPLTREISLKFVEEVLLTPGTRLYKTAGFFQKAGVGEESDDLNKKWAVMVSDYQISQTDGKAAAQYFYSGFLGCGYPESSARTTKQFYDETAKFISNLDIKEAEKSDLLNALTTYLKVDTSSTISSEDFASKYFDNIDTQDAFTDHMGEAGLPSTAFTKDTVHIDSKLKYRNIRFKSNVKISAPSDIFKEKVIFETIEGDLDASGTPEVWTKIIVKDLINDQI